MREAKKKKPTKQEQYYEGLQQVIYPLVTLSLNDVDTIRKEVLIYTHTQPYLRIKQKTGEPNELIIYMIGEQWIQLALSNIKRKKEKDPLWFISYEEVERLFYSQLLALGLYQIIVPAPELLVQSLLRVHQPVIKETLDFLMEETKTLQ